MILYKFKLMGDICSNKLCYLDNNEEDLNYYIIRKKEVYIQSINIQIVEYNKKNEKYYEKVNKFNNERIEQKNSNKNTIIMSRILENINEDN